MDGYFSLYMTQSDKDLMADIMLRIQQGMDNDELLFAHAALKKLTFLKYTIGNPNDDLGIIDDDVDGGTTPGEEIGLTPGYVAGIFIFAFLLLGCIFLARYFVIIPGEDDSDSEENWREVSNPSSLGISGDDETVHVSNKELNVELMENEGDLNLFRQLSRKSDRQNDTADANVDNVMFQPKAKEEKDGCFDFFDLILEGTGLSRSKKHRPALHSLETDDKSHMSELSF